MRAARLIAGGLLDVAMSGGSEATITPLALAGFANMTALSTSGPERASRPFDLNDGFVMAEGSATLILEEYEHALKKGRKDIRAEIAGYGSTDDAYHITSPEESGDGAFRAMAMALQLGGDRSGRSRLSERSRHFHVPERYNRNEGDQETFGCRQDLNISSTKSMRGHALGAAGR